QASHVHARGAPCSTRPRSGTGDRSSGRTKGPVVVFRASDHGALERPGTRPGEETSAEVLVDQLRHLEHRDLLLAAEDRLHLVVAVDHPALLGILEIVLADVGPELLDHLGAGNRLVADDLSEVLGRLQLLHEGGVRLALRSRRLLRRLLRGLLGGHSVGFSLPLCQGTLCGSSSSRWLRFNEAKGVRISGFRGENTRGTRFPLWKSWELPLTWTS